MRPVAIRIGFPIILVANEALALLADAVREYAPIDRIVALGDARIEYCDANPVMFREVDWAALRMQVLYAIKEGFQFGHERPS